MRAPAFALALTLAVPGAALAADPAPGEMAAHLERLAPSVVTVKFVLKVRAGGQERESTTEARACVVDATGIVMVANTNLEPGGGMFRQFRRQGMEISSTPSDFKVILGNDPKEHEAVLLARDSNLGLAYVQMLSVEGTTLKAVDLSKPQPIAIGDSLIGVTRLGRGFDYAPTIDSLQVTGKIEKPRPMWDISGTFTAAGLPVHARSGTPVGVLAVQEGAEGSADAGAFSFEGPSVFLLPLDIVAKSIEQARKRAPDALAKAKEEAAKAAAETPAGGEPPKPPEAPKVPPDPPPVQR